MQDQVKESSINRKIGDARGKSEKTGVALPVSQAHQPVCPHSVGISKNHNSQVFVKVRRMQIALQTRKPSLA